MKNDTATEIDLWQLIVNGFAFLKKRKWLIASFLIIGTLFGLVTLKINPLKYKSFYKKYFIVQSSIASDEILSDIINNLSLKLNNNTSNLMSELNISSSIVAEIKNIQAVIESSDDKKSSQLEVTIEAYENQNIDSIISGIIFYINSIEHLQLRYNLMKEQQLQLLAELNKRIVELDSIKWNLSNPVSYNNVDFMINRNAEYLSYVELLEKKQHIEKELSFNKIIDIIEINSPHVLVENTRDAVVSVIGYSFLGAIIGGIIGLMLNLYRRVKSHTISD